METYEADWPFFHSILDGEADQIWKDSQANVVSKPAAGADMREIGPAANGEAIKTPIVAHGNNTHTCCVAALAFITASLLMHMVAT